MPDRDVMEYDVVVVGAGPAGLACAIRLKQLKPDTTVCVLEKGSAVGAHSLSGAVMEPGPLDALLPEWRQAGLDICVPAGRDEFLLLTRNGWHAPADTAADAQSRQLHHLAGIADVVAGESRRSHSASTCFAGFAGCASARLR